eukprot:4162304-Lingulodinium_polyedra.AAC.1
MVSHGAVARRRHGRHWRVRRHRGRARRRRWRRLARREGRRQFWVATRRLHLLISHIHVRPPWRHKLRVVRAADVGDLRLVAPDVVHVLRGGHQELHERALAPGVRPEHLAQHQALTPSALVVPRDARPARAPPPKEGRIALRDAFQHRHAASNAAAHAADQVQAARRHMQGGQQYFIELPVCSGAPPFLGEHPAEAHHLALHGVREGSQQPHGRHRHLVRGHGHREEHGADQRAP